MVNVDYNRLYVVAHGTRDVVETRAPYLGKLRLVVRGLLGIGPRTIVSGTGAANAPRGIGQVANSVVIRVGSGEGRIVPLFRLLKSFHSFNYTHSFHCIHSLEGLLLATLGIIVGWVWIM